MPGGSMLARVSSSFNQAATRLPRFMLTAGWTCCSTCITTKTTPMNVNDGASGWCA